MLDKFYELLKESTISQALITVGVVGVWLYLVATGQTVPEELAAILTLVFGFYFGSKVGYKQGENNIMKFVPKRDDDVPALYEAQVQGVVDNAKRNE